MRYELRALMTVDGCWTVVTFGSVEVGVGMLGEMKNGESDG